jgi:hypothetical protein
MKKVCLLVSLLMLATVANADVVVFQQVLNNAFYTEVTTDWTTSGYQGCQETYMSGAGSVRAYDFGQWQNFAVGNPPSVEDRTQRGLLKWDLSALAGATVNAATVELWSRGLGAYDEASANVFALLPANADWQEGPGNIVPGQPPAAVWNFREVTVGGTEGVQQGIPWAGSVGAGTAGVDYDPTILATLTTTGNLTSNYQQYLFEIPAALVQSWVGPVDQNAGLYFRPPDPVPEEGWPGYVNFIASEWAAGQVEYAFRPKITIDYVPEPMTMVLLGLGGLMIRRKR